MLYCIYLLKNNEVSVFSLKYIIIEISPIFIKINIKISYCFLF